MKCVFISQTYDYHIVISYLQRLFHIPITLIYFSILHFSYSFYLIGMLNSVIISLKIKARESCISQNSYIYRQTWLRKFFYFKVRMRCSISLPAFPWGRLFSCGYCCRRRTGRSCQRLRSTFTTIFWPWERRRRTRSGEPQEELSRRRPSRSIRKQYRTFKLSYFSLHSFIMIREFCMNAEFKMSRRK